MVVPGTTKIGGSSSGEGRNPVVITHVGADSPLAPAFAGATAVLLRDFWPQFQLQTTLPHWPEAIKSKPFWKSLIAT